MENNTLLFTVKQSETTNGITKIDLHGLRRWEARKALFNGIFSILSKGESYLLVVHGYHGGTVHRDYIRGGQLLHDLRRIYPLLPVVTVYDYQPGATIINVSRRSSHVT